MRKPHFFDRFILLLAPCLLWGVSGYANVYAQGDDDQCQLNFPHVASCKNVTEA